MRSNGLTAASYTPIADVDPGLTAALLDDLEAHGIAAYVTPVEPSSMSVFERPEFRTSVRDRLYVDAGTSQAASRLLAALDDEVDTSGDDLAWAQIVAGFDRPRDGDVPWPSTEDVPPAAEDDSVDPSRSHEDRYDDGTGQRTSPDDEAADRRTSRGDEAADRRADSDDDSHPTPRLRTSDTDPDGFVPPTPPPLPRLEPRQQVAWMGVVGGPLLLLVSVLFRLSLPGWLSALAVGGFVLGFVALVVMMGGPDDDYTGDDGAVI